MTATFPGVTATGTSRLTVHPQKCHGVAGPRTFVTNELTSLWWFTNHWRAPSLARPRKATPSGAAEAARGRER